MINGELALTADPLPGDLSRLMAQFVFLEIDCIRVKGRQAVDWGNRILCLSAGRFLFFYTQLHLVCIMLHAGGSPASGAAGGESETYSLSSPGILSFHLAGVRKERNGPSQTGFVPARVQLSLCRGRGPS